MGFDFLTMKCGSPNDHNKIYVLWFLLSPKTDMDSGQFKNTCLFIGM